MKVRILRSSIVFSSFFCLATAVAPKAHAQSTVTLTIPGSGEFAFGSDARSSYTYSTTDVIKYLAATAADGGFTFTDASITSSTSAVCTNVERRVQVNAFELELKSTSASRILIGGNSSGAGARFLRALYVNDVLVIEDGDDERVKSSHPGGSASENCANIEVDGLSIPVGARVKVVIGGSATGTPQNFRLNSLVITPSTALPVRLQRFDAQRVATGVVLNWSASNEVEGKTYTVQRAESNLRFENLTTIAVDGTGNYRYQDNVVKPQGVLYYRLEMVSKTGVITHSHIRAVNFGEEGSLRLLGNPVQGAGVVATFATTQQPTEARIINTSGTILKKQILPAFTNQATIQTDGLQKGIYLLQVMDGNRVQTVRFIKN